MDKYRYEYFRQARELCEWAGLVCVRTNYKHRQGYVIRIYADLSHKGSPSQAIYTTEKLDRKTICEIQELCVMTYSQKNP